MKYKYNMRHMVKGKRQTVNFRNKRSFLKYLDKNVDKLNKLHAVVLNFGPVMLPLKQTVWNKESPVKTTNNNSKAGKLKPTRKKKSTRQLAKAKEKRELKKFISRLEKRG